MVLGEILHLLSALNLSCHFRELLPPAMLDAPDLGSSVEKASLKMMLVSET